MDTLSKPFSGIIVDHNMDSFALPERWIELIGRVKALHFLKPPPCGDLTTAQVALLGCVARRPGCGILEIASQLNLTPPTVSVGVRSLIERGWLKREVDRFDRRSAHLYLTPSSRALMDEIHRHQVQVMEKFLSGLTGEEQASLLRLLERAVASAEKRP